ncbi:phage portal protein [Rhodococcus sp. 15-725-2-2b]|uniref:phage portal protein n=1 Tax=unclassified Rhodococcus (in: high G+C Gram-positive bacteria) TaxID=192944 RepID=UPI000B9AF21F|nr:MULTISPECIES: phage portal protein [unclassified Rhodococcus (in: high G+C Gram-positive bacteria)]OZC71753.1 phage portal protein [Rhodococcus sp. 06-469-3-2]OZD42542.1 phage portal protein [Rhodococcus sp. 06-1477-1A]OZE68249.1 phage portal protein [Rhodococcus sp. 15-725-2-2b]
MGAIKRLFGLENITPMQIREDQLPEGYDPLSGVTPPSHSSMYLPKANELIQIDIVFRAVQYLSTLVSELEVETFLDDRKIENSSLINRPDPFQSRKAFVQETVSSMVLHGEAFWRITRNGRNEATALEVLDPEEVKIEKRNGKVRYYIGQTEIPRDSIRHLKLLPIVGKLRGIGPIQAAPQVFRFALMLQQYSEQWFSGTTPRGVLKTTDSINIDDMNDAAQGFIKFIKENQQLAVLPGGLSYESINLDPGSTRYIEVLHEVNLQLCRLLGVPAEAMEAQTQSSTTYQNLQDSNARFLQGTLLNYILEIESHLTDLLPGRRVASLRETDLLRLDPLAQRRAEAIDIRNKVVTPNEVRATRGLEPLAAEPVEQDNKTKEQPTENGD